MASTRIHLNGDPGQPIRLAHGLRQGEPLSPMLFVMVMNVLNMLLNHATKQELLHPIGHRALHHHYSLYVDDAVLFNTPTDQDLIAVTSILELFGEASRLQMNISKCTIVPICCSEQEVQRAASYIPCQISNFPITYLGIPLSTSHLRKIHLEPVVDKV